MQSKINYTIREITPADYPQLKNFLYHAIFIPAGEEYPPREIIFQPEIYVYVKDFGLDTDCGVVAEHNGTLVGAAWTRIIPAYGHLDESTPELAISVLPEYRGQGIGRLLMNRLFELLCNNGYKRTSLSVQQNNPAVRFYERLGYKITDEKVDHAGHEDYIMVKNLTEETDEERRARIYPVILCEYNPAWQEWFKEEKRNLEMLIGKDNITRISHVGSTAVPGLTAKPTVDIILEVKETTDIDKLTDALSSPEYICLSGAGLTIPTPPPHLMFLKGYLSDGFAEKVYHIHVRYPDGEDISDKLLFRDYLINHSEAVTEYAELKRKLLKDYKHNRDGYTEAKTAFIKQIIKKTKGDMV